MDRHSISKSLTLSAPRRLGDATGKAARRFLRLAVSVSMLILITASIAYAKAPYEEDVVRALSAIEKVRDKDRRGDTEATAPFEDRYSISTFESRFERDLAKSAILERRWGIVFSDEELQAELDRMARNTLRPQKLRELFATLGDDPDLIAEVLVRPVLADRRLRSQFERDTQLRALAPKLSFDAWLARQPESFAPGAMDAVVGLLLPQIIGIGSDEPDSWTLELPSGPPGKKGQSAVWTGSEMIVWGGATPGLPEKGMWTNAGFSYDPATDVWTPIRLDSTTPEPRAFHSAVWTGSTMIIWGGETWSEDGAFPYYTALDTGGIYDPVEDTWIATSPSPLTGALPSPRLDHIAVWTGDEMIIWGGLVPVIPGSQPLPAPEIPDYTALDDGSVFDPAFGDWRPMISDGTQPAARGRAAAVWTGDEMWMLGGFDGANWLDHTAVGVFSRYGPAADQWDTMPAPPWGEQFGVPIPYEGATALWTGESFWATHPSSGKLLANFDGTAWSEPTLPPPPSAFADDRRFASLVWTGSRLLLWGGADSTGQRQANGVIYDIRMDAWSIIPVVAYSPPPDLVFPSPEPRFGHFGFWTGAEMLIWGGGDAGDTSRPSNMLSSGGRFRPAWDGPEDSGTWVPMPEPPRAATQGHSMVWTGSEMIVWGGKSASPTAGAIADGLVYDPTLDTWSPTSLDNTPEGRANHTAVWTGSKMLIWGGRWTGESTPTIGGRYDPATDTWSAMADSLDGGIQGRDYHSAVWTGSEMLVFGGLDQNGLELADGGRYDPATDTWSAMAASPLDARHKHASVWTGSEMLIFGGLAWFGGFDSEIRDDAATYDPGTDSWSPSFNGVDTQRWDHSAVWTGSVMLAWGGSSEYLFQDPNPCRNDGLIVNPAGTISAIPANGDARCQHSAVWNGEEMIVWGGADRVNGPAAGASPPHALTSGGRYAADSATWTPTRDDETTIPGTRMHSAVWTGEEMLVWGGIPEISGALGVYYTDTQPFSSPKIEIDGLPGNTVLLGGAAETIALGHTLPTALFDDVEGVTQWTPSAGGGETAIWHIAEGGICAEQGDYYSPYRAYRFGEPGACHYQGPEGTYSLTSPVIEITASTLLELRYFLETDRVGNPAEQDAATIEVSIDGGVAWIPVAIDRTHWVDDGGTMPVPLDDSGDTWRGLSIRLADYVPTAPSAMVRFSFHRGGELNFATGWVIDDIGLGEPAGDGRIPAGTLVASDGSTATHPVGFHDLWDRPSFGWALSGIAGADTAHSSVPNFEFTENDLATYDLDQPGQYPLELIVSDSSGQTHSATVTLEVVDGEPPTVEVTSPNGGEAWSAESTQVISWSASDNIGLGGFDLAYYDDEAGAGPTAITCAETIDSNSRSCTWTLPATTSTAMRVEITARDLRPTPGGPNTAVDTSDAPFYVVQANSDEIRTLVVWHRDRVEALYGTTEADDLAADLSFFVSHVKVDGQVINLANVPSLDPLYAAWDGTAWATGTNADLDDNITQANALADAIRTYLFEQISNSFTKLEFLVLVGGDSSIPFHRIAENLPRYPESNYIAELQSFGFLNDASSLAAFCDETESPIMTAFCRDAYLADTPYGSSRTTGVPGSSFTWYLPDIAVGRIVETPSQIGGLIDVFVAQDGVTVVDRALTSAYDFLTDGGDAINTLLMAELDTGQTTVERLSQAVAPWTDTDLLDPMFGVNPAEPSDLTFIAGHADHRSEGAAAAGDAGSLTTQEMQAAGVSNRGSIVIGVGCHSGVPIEPDGGATDEYDAAFLLDIPEILAERSFPVLVGNGGYGWGLSEGIGLGEQLILLVAEEIVGFGQIAVGEALRRAKLEYFLRQERLDAFDHKVLLESMVLGIPNYEVRVHRPIALLSQAEIDSTDASAPQRRDRPRLGDPDWHRLELASGSVLNKTSPLPVAMDVSHAQVSTLRVLDFAYQAYEKGQDTDGNPDTADWQEAYVQFDWCTDTGGASLLCTAGVGETEVGTFFTLDGLATSESGRPIQPMISFDSRLFGTELHGILIRGGEYVQPAVINPADPAQCTDVLGTVHQCFDPVIGNPETEVDEVEGPAPTPFISFDHPTPFISFDHPTANGFVGDSTSGNDSVRFDTLNAPMGVAVRRGVKEIAPGERQEIFSQWIYRTREFTNYYSSSSDWTSPEIGSFTADCLTEISGADCFHSVAGTTVNFDVPVTDIGEGVYKVYITYTQDVNVSGEGSWLTVELTPAGGDHFIGSIEIQRTSYYLVQAVDWAGNIGTVSVSGSDTDDTGQPIGSTYDLPRLFTVGLGTIFSDGFDSGSTTRWSEAIP